jgi:hypothetical protein
MDWLVQVEQGSLGLGALIVLLSFVLYIKRTGDLKAVILVWQKRLELTHQEFFVSWIGLGLTISVSFLSTTLCLSGREHV